MQKPVTPIAENNIK